MFKNFPENLPKFWHQILADESKKDYFIALCQFLIQEKKLGKKVLPDPDKRLRALTELDFPDVQVVILGQDPYPTPGHAIGRSFAVPGSVLSKPPSLLNILKELEKDLGETLDHSQTELNHWVQQGVLLLNTCLTVEAGKPLSHRGKGWELFTDQILSALGKRPKPLVFILWGAQAQNKKFLIASHHKILEAPHPSPLSAYRGFFGSKPFSKCNEFLTECGEKPISWGKADKI